MAASGDPIRRIRDPLHGLIVFNTAKPIDRLIFELIATPAFQRLRRIKQLGFSELVFPGATHTRFAHSVGVFATARELGDIVTEEMSGSPDYDRLHTAIVAALLHDIGHGPFSHAFEAATEALGSDKRHEEWTSEIVLKDSHIRDLLESYPNISNLPDKVAELIAGEQGPDIYSAIVSSQFDADRLDYLRRDRLMTGVGYGGFDWEWLRNNLVVRKVLIAAEGEAASDPSVRPRQLHTFVLRAKAHEGIEGYVLARWHLYRQVYFHKTVRAAEQMLSIILGDVADAVRRGCPDEVGLPQNYPLVRFYAAEHPSIADYVNIDDIVVTGAMHLIASGRRPEVASLARSLLERRLFKRFPLPVAPGREKTAIERLKQAFAERRLDRWGAAVDRVVLKGYSQLDDPGKAILVEGGQTGQFEDLATVSPVVAALKPTTEFRLYCRDQVTYDQVRSVLGSDLIESDGETE